MRTKADVRRRFLNSRAHARPPSVTQECVSRSARRWARGTRNRRRDQPVGQITSCFPKWPVQPLLQKYFCFGLRQISSLSRTVPSRERGVSRSSRTRGGMRWTRQRARRTRPEADGEVVSFWHPDAGVKLAEATPLTTVSIKRGHRGEHEVSRKTIARGMPVESVCPVVTMLVCFVYFAREAAGALGIRHSLRPLISWANCFANLGRIAPRDPRR